MTRPLPKAKKRSVPTPKRHSNKDGVEQRTGETRVQRQSVLPAGNAGRWNSQLWSYPKHVGLQFGSREDLDAAIDLLWSDADLWGLPRVHVGSNTMIVPEDAVGFFQKKGCRFTLQQVTSTGDLPTEEVNRIRQGG